MKKRAMLALLSLLFWNAVVSSLAIAEDQCAIPSIANFQEAIVQFDKLQMANCLGGESCTTAECQLVTKLKSTSPGTGASEAEKRQLAERILIALGTLDSKARSISSDATQLGTVEMRGMLDRWRMPTLGSTTDDAVIVLNDSNKREWQGSNFDLYLNTPFHLQVEDAFRVKNTNQPDSANPRWCATPTQCNTNFQSIVAIYSISGLIHRTLNVAIQDQFNDVGKMLKQFDVRWTTFHTKSLAIFPWELIGNNLAYKSASNGFSGPPNYQWLLLHPSVALAYDDSQQDKMEEAILLDLVGRYQWKWGGDDGTEITKPFGVALAMSWSGDDPGYGIAVHLPRNWSIAVTRSNDDATQLLFSVEFGQFVTDKRKNVDDIRKKLENLKL